MRAGVLLACALTLAACGGKSKGGVVKTEPLEARVITAGAELLALVPEGADAALELDVMRLRANAVVGGTVRGLSPWLRARAAAGALPVDLPIEADFILAVVYDLAGEGAAMLVLVRGAAIDAAAVVAGATDLTLVDAHTFAYGPPALRERLGRGELRILTDDAAFMALRDAAMPVRAPGAALRLTARLGDEARVSAAGRLGYDGALPVSLSVWADVADDFALVALLGADDAAGAQRLAADIDAGVKKLGRLWGLPLALRRVRATPQSAEVRVVWTIGPRALADGVEKQQF